MNSFNDKNAERYMLFGRIDILCHHLRDTKYFIDQEPLGDFYFAEGQQYHHTLDSVEWRKFGEDERWGGKAYYCTFKQSFDVPDHFKGNNVFYQIMPVESRWDRDTQFTVEINGELAQGFDPNHQDLKLLECAQGGEHFDVVIYAYSDDFFYTGKKLMRSRLYTADPVTYKLYYDLFTPLLAAKCYEHDDDARIQLLKHMNEAVNMLEIDHPDREVYHKSAEKAMAYLKKNIYGKNTVNATASAIGHTHIDDAWLWTVRQTREKAGRSFATVLKLMEEFPEYRFMSSQAQLYEFVKEDYPELFERIKQAVKDGKWEVEGSMWVEPDTNVPNGESLVRQFLIGKRFFKENFGVDTQIMWEPDTFGYSPVLPQIIKKSGAKYFLTTKLSWNEFNRVPYDTFMWRGIDGTEVLTHFPPSRMYGDKKIINGYDNGFQTDYNAALDPFHVIGGWDRYSQKDLNNNYLMTFGYGDGGGGPNRDMLEYGKRMSSGMYGCPKVQIEPSLNFYKRLEKEVSSNRHLPTWVGELYFEMHRGTLTSQAANKRSNRKVEIALHNLEALGAIAKFEDGVDYDREAMTKIWKKVLLNQFHDILPGSSIRAVYDDTDRDYKELFEDIGARTDKKLAALVSKIRTDDNSIVVFNTLGVKRDDLVFIDAPDFDSFMIVDGDGNEMKSQKTYDGKVCFLAKGVPAYGYKVFKAVEGKGRDFGKVYATNKVARNKFIKIRFDRSMQIASLYHKKAERETVLPGGALGRLVAYDDRPHNHEAWDVKAFIEEKAWNIDNVVSSEIIENGAVRCVYKVVRRFRSTTFEQLIIVYQDNDRVDVVFDFDWQETRVLLRYENDVDVNASQATYDIQFGNVRRNTHENTLWDFAQFECMGHKWIDLSDSSFGFSLLNDSKYGHGVKDKVVRTSLVRSSMFPCPDQDKGRQHIELSLYAHNSAAEDSDVVWQANSLNVPLIALKAGRNDGELGDEYGFVSVDSREVIVDTVKMAEDSDEAIVRLYETFNRRTKCVLRTARPVKKAYLTNLLENEEEELEVKNGEIRLVLDPYEIKTLKITF